MPYPVPLLPDLRTQSWQQMQARIAGLSPILRRMVARPISDINAGAVWSQWRYLQNLGVQMMPDSCTGSYLDRNAGLVGIVRLGPQPAAGNCIFSGLPTTPIASGTSLTAPDDVTLFATTAGGAIGSGGTVTLPITATTPGSVGNLPGGTVMALGIAIAGVNAAAALDSNGTAGGADTELDPSLRARYLARLQNPPQGGAASDYWQWARTVAGVTRAWVYPLYAGPGTVGVTFTMDARVNPIPLSGDVATVQAALTVLAPVTATVVAFAPTAVPTAITIANLLPTSAEPAIEAALADLFATLSLPGDAAWGDYGGAQPGPLTGAGTLWLGQIEQTIQDSTGVVHFDLSAPASDVVVSAGQLATLGTVTF